MGRTRSISARFGAFAAANISGELAALLSPILAGIAPLFGGLDTEDGGSDAAANPLDMDIEEAMPAISSALSTISGDKVERMMLPPTDRPAEYQRSGRGHRRQYRHSG